MRRAVVQPGLSGGGEDANAAALCRVHSVYGQIQHHSAWWLLLLVGRDRTVGLCHQQFSLVLVFAQVLHGHSRCCLDGSRVNYLPFEFECMLYGNVNETRAT